MTPGTANKQISQPPANIEPSSKSTDDSANESNWSNRSVKAASLSLAGFAVTSLLNQDSPPGSFGQSLLRYTISQVPAMLYLLATTKVDPSLLIKLNRNLESSILKEAGIPQERAICVAKCIMWLNKPEDFPIFDSSVLKDAYEKIYEQSSNRYYGMVNHLDLTGWQCDANYIANPDFVKEDLPLAESPPIDSLNINDALFCITTPKKNEEGKEGKEGIAHVCVVLKRSESEFTIYEPNASLPIKTENTKSCIEELVKLAELQRQEFFLFTKVVRKKE